MTATVQLPAPSSIARRESRRVALPTGIASFTLPNGRRTPTDLPALLVRLVGHDGVTGHGLLWAQSEPQLAVMEASVRCVAAATGTTADDPSSASAVADSVDFLGAEGAAAFGVSGYVMALEDLAWRRDGTSLGADVGRVRSSVPVYRTGLMLHSSIDELVAEATDVAERGFGGVKMILGRPSIDDDAERVAAVRAALPDHVALMADALQRWDLGTARRATERLADHGLRWIEDPLHHRDVAGYAELVSRSPVPIATGESLFTTDAFRRLLDAGLPYVVCEPERIGGAGRWLEVADLARRAGATALPHLYPHLSVQMLATLDQPEVWVEYVPWFDELAGELVVGPEGIEVDTRPGAGFHPDAQAVERLATGPWVSLA